jgi:hypothetical protein
VVVFGEHLTRRRSRTLKRYAPLCVVRAGRRIRRPAIHRFRRSTEPWALDALPTSARWSWWALSRRRGSPIRRRRSSAATSSVSSRPRDRTYPRPHRRGTGSGDDSDARGSARARALARERRGGNVSAERAWPCRSSGA